MNQDTLKSLRIDPGQKRRPQRMLWIIFTSIAVVTAAVIYLAWPRPEGERHLGGAWKSKSAQTSNGPAVAANSDPNRSRPSGGGATAQAATTPGSPSVGARTADDVVLTVSGYIINRERIELSPRFMGVVKWIGVKKGDVVTNGQVVVLLDDAEYQARKHELEGRLALAQVAVRRAEVELKRTSDLAKANIETQRTLDLAQLDLESAKAQVKALEGERQTLDTYLDWCVIRSPIDGVVLEKLTEASELVTPQSFGGTRGPSTALISVGDPKDLQVEVDLNEADLSKIHLNQKCRVSPEAYPDKGYGGWVAEIAPEANRQKGTLQVKVQIQSPDHFLTPELSAKVDFLSRQDAPSKP